MGHSHAIYNATDKPVQWMNINVSAMKGTYDAFNLDDPRVDVPLDPIPVFMAMRLDRALLRPVDGMNGGKGTVQYRRALDTSVFARPVGLCGPPDASSGHLDRSASASRSGRILLRHEWPGYGDRLRGRPQRPGSGDAETAEIQAGDAIPIQLGEVHSFENTGDEPSGIHDRRRVP